MHIQQTRSWFMKQYGVGEKYLRRICKELSIPQNVALTPNHVKKLKEYLGEPIKA